MRLVTWNINSIRMRIELVRRIAEELRPDVLCLQETKVPDPLFPVDACTDMGFEHVAFRGMKGYNGVAILSKRPFEELRHPDWCGREDCRHLVARVSGIDIHNLYIPAGGDIPDPEANDKFAHKLDFVDSLAAHYAEQVRPGDKAILCGDFNIAPLETDVWSHKQLLGVVSHTPVEVDKLGRMQASVPFVDAVRHFIPETERLYTWWSYRNQDWAKSDRGRRLDHVWVTPALKDSLHATMVVREARDWPQPSDHVPVMVDLEG